MARRRKGGKKESGGTMDGESETQSEGMVEFSNRLSPLMGCPDSVRTRTKRESLGALVSILLAVVPMNGLTRSLVLLCGLLLLIDIVWRSVYCHWWKAGPKILATVLLTVVYLTVAATLILGEHPSASLAFNTYVKSDQFFHLLLFFGGAITTYLSIKSFSLIKSYLKSRIAENLAIRKNFSDSQKGWLDYRVDSEQSSERLHILIGRMGRGLGMIAQAGKIGKWFLGKKPSLTGKHTYASMLATALDMCSARFETNLEEFGLTTDLFIQSTEGHLRTSKQDYARLSLAHEYFETQLKDIHEVRVFMPQLPKTFLQARGISQDLTASIDRSVSVFRAHIDILYKLEKHCAQMTRLTLAKRDRAFVKPFKKPLQKLVASLESLAETIGKDATVQNEKISES